MQKTRRIKLSKGFESIIDAEDYQWASKYSWYYLTGYAVRTTKRNGKNTYHFLHRLITKTPAGLDTDHINRNTLDNRKSNLRIATRSENIWNSKLRTDNTSGHRGVIRVGRKWRAQIGQNRNGIRKNILLGDFVLKQDAVDAYRQRAVSLSNNFVKI